MYMTYIFYNLVAFTVLSTKQLNLMVYLGFHLGNPLNCFINYFKSLCHAYLLSMFHTSPHNACQIIMSKKRDFQILPSSCVQLFINDNQLGCISRINILYTFHCRHLVKYPYYEIDSYFVLILAVSLSFSHEYFNDF